MLDAQSNPTRTYLDRRVEEFRAQVQRRIDGSLTEDEFRPLRLMNGLYLQLHAYMLRVAIPYGTLNSAQMRQLAYIAERWDKGYGHFTTRQNIQYNWPQLRDVPDMLDALAEGRACRLDSDFALHLTEVTLAMQNAGEETGPQDMTTTCPQPEPMPWAR